MADLDSSTVYGNLNVTRKVSTQDIEIAGQLVVNNNTEIPNLNSQLHSGKTINDISNGSMTWAGTTAGSLNGSVYNYTASLSPTPTALVAGQRVTFKTHAIGGTTSTLNLSGLGAKTIYKQDGTVATLKLNVVYTVVYDGSAFILQGEGGGEYGTATASDVRAGKTIGTENGLINGTATLVVTPGPGTNLVAKVTTPYASNSTTAQEIIRIMPGTLTPFGSFNVKGRLTATGGTNGTQVTLYVQNTETYAYVGSSSINDFDFDVPMYYDGIPISLQSSSSTTTATLVNIQILSNVPTRIDNMTPSGETGAVAANVLAGKTVYVDGVKMIGTMQDMTGSDRSAYAVSMSEGSVRLAIPTAGYYSQYQAIYLNSAIFAASSIVKGKNMAGLSGTAPTYTGPSGSSTGNFNNVSYQIGNISGNADVMKVSTYGTYDSGPGGYLPFSYTCYFPFYNARGNTFTVWWTYDYTTGSSVVSTSVTIASPGTSFNLTTPSMPAGNNTTGISWTAIKFS